MRSQQKDNLGAQKMDRPSGAGSGGVKEMGTAASARSGKKSEEGRK